MIRARMGRVLALVVLCIGSIVWIASAGQRGSIIRVIDITSEESIRAQQLTDDYAEAERRLADAQKAWNDFDEQERRTYKVPDGSAVEFDRDFRVIIVRATPDAVDKAAERTRLQNEQVRRTLDSRECCGDRNAQH